MAAAVVLPMMLFGLAGWESYELALRAARSRVERTARVLEEHALKVFETNRLVLDAVDARLRDLDWNSAAQRADLHRFLQGMQTELDQVAVITVTDAEGRMRASGRVFPADPAISFADRDWFEALKHSSGRLPYISTAYVGRQSGQLVFNVAERAPPAADGAFNGIVAISVDSSYFARFYRSAETSYEHSVILVRSDGQILAAEPSLSVDRLAPNSALFALERQAASGSYERVSTLDGVDRFFAYRKVGSYPIYVRFGIGRAAALASWRANLINFGLVAAGTSLCLAAAAVLALRQTARWQRAAQALEAEAARRDMVEAQIRQLQKMEAVGQLTGGIAHDFNNMLSVIIGGLNLVQRRLAKGDTDVEHYIRMSMDGATRAVTLIQRLLAFSRQQPLQPDVVVVNDLVAGLSELLRRSLGETVRLETVLAGGLWKARVDANQLENAVLNLAVNARDAMPEGGRLTIETANTHLDDAYAREHEVASGQYVMIAVTDTGTGMTPEVVAKAFDPFFTTKEVGKGTGLGLSQTYGFVRQSSGHIKVYSELGHGTTFKIYLPRSFDDKPATPPSDRPPVVPPGGAAKEVILVVEDDARVRNISVEALRDLGYGVIPAASGKEALALLRDAADVALLFTDVVMPGMSGRELADLAIAERPGIKVLFTTGYTRNAIVHNGALDPGVELISKPFLVEALAVKIRSILDAAPAVRR